MKKMMTMLMAVVMVLSLSVAAFAAPAQYSVRIDNDQLHLTKGKEETVYDLDASKMSLLPNEDDGITLLFWTTDKGRTEVSLSKQQKLSVAGKLDELNINKSLDKDCEITIAKDAKIKQLFSSSDASIEVDGEITKAYLVSKAVHFTVNDDGEVDMVYANNKNSVRGLLPHHIAQYVDNMAVESVATTSTDNSSNAKYDLGISNIVDRGDRVSFYCSVSGATVRLNGKKIGTTVRGTNTFDVDSYRFWDDKLTIEKDGYWSENIYLDHFYYDGYYYYVDGVRYRRVY